MKAVAPFKFKSFYFSPPPPIPDIKNLTHHQIREYIQTNFSNHLNQIEKNLISYFLRSESLSNHINVGFNLKASVIIEKIFIPIIISELKELPCHTKETYNNKLDDITLSWEKHYTTSLKTLLKQNKLNFFKDITCFHLLNFQYPNNDI